MSNDFDIESLSKAWQSHDVVDQFDQAKLKKQLLRKQFTLLSFTILEVCILLVTAGLLVLAFSQFWPIHLKLGLMFALITGGIAYTLILKSRIKSYQMLTSPTTDWMKFEGQISQEALKRGKYTNYFIAIFSAALVIVFIYELLFLESVLINLATRYAFGVTWLLAAWLINRHQMKKHEHYLSKLK